MQIETRELEPCHLLVDYTANAEEIAAKKSEILSMFKKAPIPGFRQGRASNDVINMYYRSQISHALKNALMEEAFYNTLFEKQIKSHGQPQIKSSLFIKDTFVCEFEIYIRPNFTLSDSYKNLTIPKPPEPMTIADLGEKMLQKIRIDQGETSPYEENDFVQDKDNVIIDYEAFIDGIKNEALSAIGDMVNIGNEKIAGFDHNLLGMVIGETREFDLKIADQASPFFDKIIHFKVTLNNGSKNIPHSLDDSLAQKIGVKDLEQLRQIIYSNATSRLQETNRSNINAAICNRLASDNPIDVPEWMTVSEAKFLAKQSKIDWDKLIDEHKIKLMNMAKRNVTVSLVLEKIREVEPETQLSDQEVYQMVQKYLENRVKDINATIKEMEKTGQLQVIFASIRDERVIDFIFKKTQLTE